MYYINSPKRSLLGKLFNKQTITIVVKKTNLFYIMKLNYAITTILAVPN